MRVDLEKLESVYHNWKTQQDHDEKQFLSVAILGIIPSLITELRETRLALEQAIEVGGFRIVESAGYRYIQCFQDRIYLTTDPVPELAKALGVEE